MSGSSNNSWTIVTPEETAAETLRPLAEGRGGQDEPNAPTEDFGAKSSDGADMLPVEDHLKSEEITTNQSETDYNASVSDLGVPASPEVIGSSVPDSQAEDPPVASALSSTELESFSDSYTHLSPCRDESQASPLTAETLGHLDSGQEEEVRGQTDIHDETQHQTTEFQQESDTPQWTHLETPPDSTVESEVIEEKPETEPEVRRRRSLLAALERIGRTDDEEDAEEDFQLPQREEDTGITLNKCILGAVILLGLGTIFISGVFMDLDEAESDYSSSELTDAEAPGKQEWLNPDVAQTAAEADTAELLNTLAKGNEHITVLQAQLQSQNEELKAAKAQTTAEMERLQHGEVEKENTAAETPSSGQTEDSRPVLKDQQVQKTDAHDTGERKEWKDERSKMKKEKKQRKDGGKMEGKEKERKKDQSESGRFEKHQKAHKQHKEDKHSEHSDEPKEWKKGKSKKEWERGDDGKPRKDKNEKKEWKDKSEKKSKHDQFNDDKHWKEEKRDLKGGKHHKDAYEGNGEKSWKKGGDYHKEESQERKQWKDKNSWENKNDKNDGERKPWSEDYRKNGNDDKKWKKRDDGKQGRERQKEKKHKDQWHEEKHKHKTSDHKEHTWTEKKPAHSHNKPSPSQPEYWADQRTRIQHSTRPLQSCDNPDTCAQAEGVRPVHFNEFDTILQNYLSKAQAAGVDAWQIDQLQKLATESFQNGVFLHDQMSFQDYVEDVGDILEDLVEGEDSDGDQDSTIEDEMEGFEREVMQTFVLSGSGEQESVRGERSKESTRGRG